MRFCLDAMQHMNLNPSYVWSLIDHKKLAIPKDYLKIRNTLIKTKILQQHIKQSLEEENNVIYLKQQSARGFSSLL